MDMASDYLHRNYEQDCSGNYLFCTNGRVLGKVKTDVLDRTPLEQAHRYVLVHSDTLEVYRRYILLSVGNKWKNYKSKLKKKYFKRETFTLAEIITRVPEGVNAHQWKDLVLHWYKDASEKASELGKRARGCVRTLHASGSTSFAQKRHLFHQKYDRSPSRMEAFSYQHKGPSGNFVNEATRQIMEDASKLIVEKFVPVISESEKIALENEVYDEVVGLDKCGRVRGYGLGVTTAKINGGITTALGNEHYEAMFREYQATITEQAEALERARAEQAEALERARAEQAEALERVRVEQAEALERVRADARAEMLDILKGFGLTKA